MAKTWLQMTLDEKLQYLERENEMAQRMMGATQDAMQAALAKHQSDVQAQIDELGESRDAP
jgi:hypothetical protein